MKEAFFFPRVKRKRDKDAAILRKDGIPSSGKMGGIEFCDLSAVQVAAAQNDFTVSRAVVPVIEKRPGTAEIFGAAVFKQSGRF